MRLLRKKREEQGSSETAEEVEPTVCEHVQLIPRWDSVESMGRTDEVSGYRCDACGAEFTPDEAVSLRATESARIQRKIAS